MQGLAEGGQHEATPVLVTQCEWRRSQASQGQARLRELWSTPEFQAMEGCAKMLGLLEAESHKETTCLVFVEGLGGHATLQGPESARPEDS